VARKRFSPEQIIMMLREIGQPRSTQRHERQVPDDEERLVNQIVKLATQYGR
jgi:hypothetical protein